ncbi:MAG: helix-turn-helix domain-containing protein [Eubacterium sp.]|uniref:helix-turn-helix domain-containing protein n=1 Tax=uncultured Eubacterium sp. TaxID=165185 RepID=UPI0025EF4D62|nr:helix-turn-helix domain-containing protein [uncultured Eubacterium sp.]
MKYNSYEDMPMFLSIKDVSETVGLSISRIYDIANTDKTFPCVILGRRKVVPRDEFKDWIKTSSKGF